MKVIVFFTKIWFRFRCFFTKCMTWLSLYHLVLLKGRCSVLNPQSYIDTESPVICCLIYKIGHISAIFGDRDFWFGPNNSIKLCAEHFTTLGVIKYISGHVTAH